MRRLLFFSYEFIIIFFSSFLFGCETSTSFMDFQPKSYDEYYNFLENTTIQIEMVVNNKRAVCTYTNDGTIYVYTIKYQHSNEYGYIYNTLSNELFCLEDKVIGGVTIATLGDSIICNNTLEHRMNQALITALPLIRKTIFPSLGNRETVQ